MRIETTNLILRTFVIEDSKSVSDVSKQKSVAVEMSDMIMASESEALDWIKMVNSEEMSNKLTMLAIESKDRKKCIGYVYLHSKSELEGEVELAYAIHDDYQNNGYATEASEALIDWAFKNKEYEYFVAITKPVNLASQKVVEKLKFKRIEERIVEHDGVEQPFYYYKISRLDWLN